MIYDVAVIGGGPAGISSALYAHRANLNVIVIHNGPAALEKAHKIENYYGFPEGISGPDLYENGIKQAQNLGIKVIKSEITHMAMEADKTFSITAGSDKAEKILSKTIIVSTGNKKLRPPIKGVIDYEGHGVSYCAICDAFFYRKKDVVIIGSGKFAVSEADDIVNVASSVKILTNGDNVSAIKAIAGEKYAIDTRKITEIKGDELTGKVNSIVFEDGEILKTDGVFIALGEAGAVDFAKKMGIILNGDSIKVDDKMQTNIKGVFSAGNSTGGLLQVSKAVYEGAVAGLSAVNYLRSMNEA